MSVEIQVIEINEQQMQFTATANDNGRVLLKRAFKFNTKTKKHIESVIRKELKTFDKPSYGGIEIVFMCRMGAVT